VCRIHIHCSPRWLACSILSLNVPLSLVGAATAVSLDSLLSLAAMWACFMVYSLVAGSCLGKRVNTIKVPVETNEVVRDIPQNLALWRPFATVFWCGVFTSSTISIESTVWHASSRHQGTLEIVLK
jgi:hypothetical protein